MRRLGINNLAAIVAGFVAVTASWCVAGEGEFVPWKPVMLGRARPAGVEGKIESLKFDVGASLTTTAARFDMGWVIVASQRLPVERDVAVLRLQHGLVMYAEQIDDYTCRVECTNSTLTFMGDSTLVFKPKTDANVDILLMIKPEHQAQKKGCVLALDSNGGIGFAPTGDDALQSQNRPTFWGDLGMSFERDEAGRATFARFRKAKTPDGKVAMGPEWQKDFGDLSYRVKAGQELWISIFPQKQPLDTQAFIASTEKVVDPFKEAGIGNASQYPTPEAYTAARAKRIEQFNSFTPYPGPEMLRFVNSKAYFHDAALTKDLRNGQSMQANLYRSGGTVTFRHTNTSKSPLPMTLTWDAPGWKVKPESAKATVEPGGASETTFTFEPSTGDAAPKIVASYELTDVNGKPVTQTHVFSIPVNEVSTVPRIAALSGLDAVAGALQSQKPWIVRTEGAGMVVEDTPATQGRMKFTHPPAGDVTAEVRMAVAGEHLAFFAKVADPACKPDVPKWTNPESKIAAVDLYISKPGETVVRQVHFRALAPNGDKTVLLVQSGTPAGDVTFPCKITATQPSGYEIHALVPLKDCLLEPGDDRFLFDVALLARNQFRLLHTGDPVRCAYRNNRYFGLVSVQGGK